MTKNNTTVDLIGITQIEFSNTLRKMVKDQKCQK